MVVEFDTPKDNTYLPKEAEPHVQQQLDPQDWYYYCLLLNFTYNTERP